MSKKVILRKLVKTDADALFNLVQDRAISQFTFTPYPYKLENATELIKTFQKLFRKKTGYGFGIVDIESGNLAGMIIIVSIDNKHKKAETAYWLGEVYRGKGLMSESLQLVLRYAFRELKLNRIAAVVFPENKNSIKLLKKAGYTKEGLMKKYVKHHNRWRDCFLYSILKEEWIANRDSR